MAHRPEDPLASRALVRVGTTLSGRYRLMRLIGIGGMGAVYAGVHRNGYPVAIKILHDRLSSDPEIERLFRREALLANKVSHPGVVPVTDDDVSDDGCVFLVMPLLEGETLRRRWEHRDMQLPLDEVVTVAHAVLEILTAAHAAKIVHRDVKPDNVFLERDGTVRILDFGIARFFETNDPASATRSGRAVGTPAFMAPEQALGRLREVDGRTDVWALGATIYALLSGRFVHVAETGSEVIVRAATQPAEPLRASAPNVPEAIAAVVDRALAFDRQARWPDAAAMDRALIAAYEASFGRPVTALPPLTHRMTPKELEDVHSILTQPPLAAARAASGEATEEPGADELSVTSAPTRPPELAPARARDPDESATSTTTAVESTRHGPSPEDPSRDASTARRGAFQRVPKPLRWATAAAAALAGTAALGAYAQHAHSAKPREDAKIAAPAPAPSVDPKALAHFNAGVQAWRDASLANARQEFEKAAEIDPQFPDPHVYILAVDLWPTASTQDHFRIAFEHRTTLEARLANLLQALEPLARPSPELAEAEHRLVELGKRYPHDFPILFTLGYVRIKLGRLQEAVSLFDDLTSQDPTLAAAWYGKAVSLILNNEEGPAKLAYKRCLELAPLSHQCLSDTFFVEALNGECAAAERSARNLVASQPNTPRSFLWLAQALLGKGAPIEAVRAALAQEWSATPEEQRELARLQDEVSLDAYQGNFDLALQRGRQWQALIASALDEKTHYVVARILMDTLTEVGDIAGLEHVANDFARQRDAWRQSGYYDHSLTSWTTRYRAGTISRSTFTEHRDAWLEHETARPMLVAARGTRWIMAFAEPTVTEADAVEAVSQLPNYMPMADSTTRTPDFDDAIGFTFLLAGRTDEAIHYLRRAASSCAALDQPIAHTVASLHLGQAFEKQRDLGAACAAYEVVVTRWGHSPKSATARTARNRFAALHCSPGQATSSPSR